MTKKSRRLPGVVLSLLIRTVGCTGSQTESPLKLEVHFTERAASRIADLALEVPVTGRVFVIITRDEESEPREQAGIMGVPLWGKDVRELESGDRVRLFRRRPFHSRISVRKHPRYSAGGLHHSSVFERLHHLPPRGRACRRDASQQRSASETFPFAGKPLQRTAKTPFGSKSQRDGGTKADRGHSSFPSLEVGRGVTARPLQRHGVGEVRQGQERKGLRVLGPRYVYRRQRASPEGLRRKSRR